MNPYLSRNVSYVRAIVNRDDGRLNLPVLTEEIMKRNYGNITLSRMHARDAIEEAEERGIIKSGKARGLMILAYGLGSDVYYLSPEIEQEKIRQRRIEEEKERRVA